MEIAYRFIANLHNSILPKGKSHQIALNVSKEEDRTEPEDRLAHWVVAYDPSIERFDSCIRNSCGYGTYIPLYT